VKQLSGISRGKQLCHWYIGNASGVASIHRTNFDKQTNLKARSGG